MRGAFFCDGGGEKESVPGALPAHRASGAHKARRTTGRRKEESLCSSFHLGGWVSTVPEVASRQSNAIITGHFISLLNNRAVGVNICVCVATV